jgi:galactokinase
MPERVFRAPGRVNLIGDHTDYNDGFVLPLAIDLECVVRALPCGTVRLRSRDVAGEHELPSDGSAEPSEAPGWSSYAAGVLRALAARGRPPAGMEAAVSSSVPVGAGLSSSAALEVSLALALCHAAGFALPPLELALACQEAEQIATGVPCGIMDQLTSIAGREGCALLIDCRSLEVEPVPLPAELAVLVVHSGVARELVDSEYAERRRECEAAAERIGVVSLRDATLAQAGADRRARHVVTENARVLEAADALARGELAALGPLLAASHRSLRDDYEVSTPELDALVDCLETAGALGARLTGAGFGGCVVALARRDDADRVAAEAESDYRARTGLEPRAYLCRASAGASESRGGV